MWILAYGQAGAPAGDSSAEGACRIGIDQLFALPLRFGRNVARAVVDPPGPDIAGQECTLPLFATGVTPPGFQAGSPAALECGVPLLLAVLVVKDLTAVESVAADGSDARAPRHP